MKNEKEFSLTSVTSSDNWDVSKKISFRYSMLSLVLAVIGYSGYGLIVGDLPVIFGISRWADIIFIPISIYLTSLSCCMLFLDYDAPLWFYVSSMSIPWTFIMIGVNHGFAISLIASIPTFVFLFVCAKSIELVHKKITSDLINGTSGC